MTLGAHKTKNHLRGIHHDKTRCCNGYCKLVVSYRVRGVCCPHYVGAQYPNESTVRVYTNEPISNARIVAHTLNLFPGAKKVFKMKHTVKFTDRTVTFDNEKEILAVLFAYIENALSKFTTLGDTTQALVGVANQVGDFKALRASINKYADELVGVSKTFEKVLGDFHNETKKYGAVTSEMVVTVANKLTDNKIPVAPPKVNAWKKPTEVN